MRICIRFGLVAFCWLSAMAAAQPQETLPEKPGCQRLNASRLPAPECGMILSADAPLVIEMPGVAVTIKVPPIETQNCQAAITLDYSQVDTLARVKSTIENKTCAASSGSYTLAISTRGEDRELKTQEFSQAWSRSDDQAVELKTDYPIGENVDLVRVRPLGSQCKCASLDSPERNAVPGAAIPD